MKNERALKVCLLGDFAVGKTSLTRRFVSSQFSDHYITTVGVKIEIRYVTLPSGEALKLLVWDIAGADRLSGATKSYLRGTHGVLLVADGTRLSTLDAAMALRVEVSNMLGAGIPLVGVVNKSDLKADWRVDEEFFRTHMHWSKASALSGDGVEAAFLALAQQIVDAG